LYTILHGNKMRRNSKPLREIVYNKVIEYINSGKITPGEKLTEAQLAREFHVSRTPVREALIQLEKKGVIAFKTNVGAVVKKITLRQIQDIFNIISVLEGYAVEIIATRNIGKDDVVYLKRLHREMKYLAETKNYFRYAEKDAEFHGFFVQKAGNDALYEVVQDLRSKVYTVGLTLPFYIDKYLAKHEKIINAISKGKSNEAGKLMKEHVQEIKIFLTNTLKQFRINPSSYVKNIDRD